MRHPLVPSLEVLGAISESDLSEQSFFGSNPEREDRAAQHSSSSPPYAAPALPGPILYVDRMPRRRHTDDCQIEVGYIAAWRSLNGASQGVFFLTIDEAREFIRLARRGIHTHGSFIFRAASITKFNAGTGRDEHSLVVDAQLHNERSDGTPEWITPWHVDPIPHT
ncbi:hypothetical protein HMPREF3159_03810 [Brachybacterium sp. HMSC06H03]|uniref:hypothetical protein n=1 Tax=Brachybacterium sp. HMSC06H03 TaxID=1581127 RepID=UPI0008A33927|nr:hypothetical protein [Brachybacterium sp. HMSC06H03]OFT62645.1 hypothetical protein HMPREF3159_03810 [Brachybacterium sp. HMSC06H03]